MGFFLHTAKIVCLQTVTVFVTHQIIKKWSKMGDIFPSLPASTPESEQKREVSVLPDLILFRYKSLHTHIHTLLLPVVLYKTGLVHMNLFACSSIRWTPIQVSIWRCTSFLLMSTQQPKAWLYCGFTNSVAIDKHSAFPLSHPFLQTATNSGSLWNVQYFSGVETSVKFLKQKNYRFLN